MRSPTLYASALITINKNGYSKHYFEGANRICSKIGGGFSHVDWHSIDDSVPSLSENYEMQYLRQQMGLQHTLMGCVGGDIGTEGIANLYAVLKHEYTRNEPEPVFYYHSDHLGSTSYLTDEWGYVTQTLNYLPYGEDWVDLQNHFETRYPLLGVYAFNGKEKDYESGFHYYGARYYWSELLTGWLSVDPMADKYPSMSPYNYCVWNPVMLVDPDGREIDPSGIFDQNGDAKKGCEFACKAFLFFAQTRYGQKTLARFAKKGQTIAGHTYTTDGDYHKEGIDLGFRVGKLRNGSSASGETGYDITGSDNSGRMRLTISLCNPVVACDDDNIAGFLQTICHEMYFHAYNYAADFMDDRTINDSEISSYLKEGRNYTSRNMWHEVQDLRHNHAYRNNAIPIMSEFFGKTKTRAETIEWMSKQGRYFKHCKNWHKK
jgi:RHS repeat-associated protein